jgi:hypothetical protein
VILHSERNSQLQVALNPIGRTNLLKTVKRPLGGKFEIEYVREGNTYDIPQSQWVMSSIRLTDGRGNAYHTRYNYRAGYHNRYEREFYGFDRVVETQAASDTLVQRMITRTYGPSDTSVQKDVLNTTITRVLQRPSPQPAEARSGRNLRTNTAWQMWRSPTPRRLLQVPELYKLQLFLRHRQRYA